MLISLVVLSLSVFLMGNSFNSTFEAVAFAVLGTIAGVVVDVDHLLYALVFIPKERRTLLSLMVHLELGELVEKLFQITKFYRGSRVRTYLALYALTHGAFILICIISSSYVFDEINARAIMIGLTAHYVCDVINIPIYLKKNRLIA